MLIAVAFPAAAAECNLPELWRTLGAAEEAVNECHRRLRVSDVNNATASACIQAKASWIHHATVFDACLQDATSVSALLGDDLHEFVERGEKMNDMQRINNEMIKERTAPPQNGGEPTAGISRNDADRNRGRANEDCSGADLQTEAPRGLREC